MNIKWITKKYKDAIIVYSPEVLGILSVFEGQIYCQVYPGYVDTNLKMTYDESTTFFDTIDEAKEGLARYNQEIEFKLDGTQYVCDKVFGNITKENDQWCANFHIFTSRFPTFEEAQQKLITICMEMTNQCLPDFNDT